MPNFEGFPVGVQIAEVKFEAATYELLTSEPTILASRLLYYRIPTQHGGPRIKTPRNLAGRRLMVFEKAEGENGMWDDLDIERKVGAHFYCSTQKTFPWANKIPGISPLPSCPHPCLAIQFQPSNCVQHDVAS
jgi:hypothetical protein